MIDEQDYAKLETYFNRIYKRLSDCEKEMDEAKERQHSLDKQFSVINTKLSALLWGGGVLVTALVGVLARLLFKV